MPAKKLISGLLVYSHSRCSETSVKRLRNATFNNLTRGVHYLNSHRPKASTTLVLLIEAINSEKKLSEMITITVSNELPCKYTNLLLKGSE